MAPKRPEPADAAAPHRRVKTQTPAEDNLAGAQNGSASRESSRWRTNDNASRSGWRRETYQALAQKARGIIAARDPIYGVAHPANSSHNDGMRLVKSDPALDAAGMTRALLRLQAVVKERGLKASSTRDSIARAALSRRGHFSVDELLADLRARGAREVHTATVYRVLPLLVEAGLLQMTLVSNREGARYERAFERDHHDHLICTACGKIIEFEHEAIEVLQRDIAERFGFRLTGHIHELLGTCADCDPQR